MQVFVICLIAIVKMCSISFLLYDNTISVNKNIFRFKKKKKNSEQYSNKVLVKVILLPPIIRLLTE